MTSVGQKGRDIWQNAIKVLGVTGVILAVLWALTSAQGQRFFIHFGDQVVEITPVEQIPIKDTYGENK